MHHPFWKFAKLLAIIAFALFVLNIVVDNPYTHFIVRKVINEKVEELTPFSVEFESVHVSLVPLQVDLYGFRLRPKQDRDHVLLAVSRFQARVALWTLFAGKIRLSGVDLYELNVNWPPQMALVWPEDKKKNEAIPWPPEFDPRLTRVSIHNGSVSFASSYAASLDNPPLIAGRADGINAEMNFKSWENIDVNLAVNALGLTYKGRPMLQPTRLDSSFALRKEVVNATKLVLEGPQIKSVGKLNALLKVDRRRHEKMGRSTEADALTGVELGMELDVDADLAPLGALINSTTTQGPVAGKVNIAVVAGFKEGDKVVWDIDVNGKSKGAEIDGFKLYDSETRLKINEDELLFEDAKVKVGSEQYATGGGFIKLNDALDMRFDIVPDKLPLKTLLGAVKVPDFKPIQAWLTSPRIILSGKGDPFKLDIRGPLLLEDMTLGMIKPNDKAKPSCATNVKIEIDVDQLQIVDGFARCLPPGQNGPWVSLVPDKIAAVERDGHGFVLHGPITFDNARGLDLKLALHRFDVRSMQGFTGLPYEGTADGNMRIHGPYDKIKIDVTASSPELRLFGLSFEKFTGALSYDVEANVLDVTNAHTTLSNGGLAEIKQARLGFDGDWPFRGRIRVNNLSQDWFRQLNSAVSMTPSVILAVDELDAAVDLPLLKPFKGRGEVSAKLREIKVDDKSIAHELQCHLRGDNSGWQAKDCQLNLGDFYANLDLQHTRHGGAAAAKLSPLAEMLREVGFSPQDELQGKLTWQTGKTKMDVRRGANAFANLPYIGEIFSSLELSGALKGDFVLQGTTNDLQGQFWTEAERMRLGKAPVAAIYAKGFFDNGRFDLVDLRQSGAALRARLTLDTSKPGVPFYLFVRTFNFDLRTVLGKVFYQDARNFLYVTSEIQYEGKFADWWQGKGYIKLQGINGGVALDGGSRSDLMKANLDKPVYLSMEKGLWQTKDKEAIRLIGEMVDLTLQVDGSQMPSGLAVSWSGLVRIDPLAKTFSFLETAKGGVSIEGAVSGSLDEPDITLFVRSQKATDSKNFEPLSFGFAGFLPAFTQVDFELAYEDGIFRVEHFSAQKGNQGRLNIAGTINPGLPLMPESRLVIDISELEFNRLSIPVLKTADAAISGNLVLTGRQLPLKLSGNVDFTRASSIGNFDLRDQILDVIRKKRYNLSSAPQEPVVAFDIQISAPDSVRIKNRNMATSLSADLLLMGNNAAPFALGQMKITKGTFIYKRDFDITRGNITFEEPISPPDPRLDIAGETIVSQYRVTTTITGYASDPVVTLSVDPPTRPDGTAISKLDILYLLSSGNLPRSEPGNVSAGGATARSEAFNLLLGQFEEPIEKIFDLSGQTVIRDVYLDTYPSESKENTGRPVARLNMPIHITDSINLVLQVDDDFNNKISSEYSINDNISVTGSFDRRKDEESTSATTVPVDTNIDLKFRFSFP